MRDDDPRQALMHLRRPHTQRDHEDTQRLLVAGLELITEGMGDGDAGGTWSMTFRWPTRAQVVRRYNEKTGLRMSKAVFEDRWRTGEDFSADLLGWAMHKGQWAAHREIAATAAAMMTDTETFAAVARHIALADVKVLLGATTFRIKLLTCSMRRVDPGIRQALAEFYIAANRWWGEVYEQILGSSGLVLRPDVELRTFAMLMTALEEGLVIRFLAHPESFGHRVEEVAEALTTGALALLGGASTDEADVIGLREFTDARMGHRRAPRAGDK
jgi:hypothetical protein